MAIKTIRPGRTQFDGFCDRCGCEFTYELDDLKLSGSSDKVACPTCKKDFYHKPAKPIATPYSLKDLTWPPDPIQCTPDETKTDPCAGCAWRENLLKNGSYIGDTPCTWCNKNKFNNTTTGTSIQSTSTLEQYISPDIKDLDAKSTSSTSSTGSTYTLYSCCNVYDKPEMDKRLQEVYAAVDAKTAIVAQENVGATLKACHGCLSDVNKYDGTGGQNYCSGECKCGNKGKHKGKH